MSKETLEHLSSLMDGETSQESGLFLARRVCSDQQLAKTWERYHLIRDCMRSSGTSWSVSQVTMQIDEILPGEPTFGVAQSPPSNRWLRPLSGIAIAASVALTAVLLVAPGSDNSAPLETAQPFSSPNTLNVSPPSQAASFEVGSSSTGRVTNSGRMNSYLVRHNQVAGSMNRQGFVSMVPIVSSAAQPAAAEQTEEAPAAENPGAVSDTP